VAMVERPASFMDIAALEMLIIGILLPKGRWISLASSQRPRGLQYCSHYAL
jgi:hypothetical protein